MKNITYKYYWLFFLLLTLILTLPSLTQRGMFLDGVTYAAIAKNLSKGIGTFFTPYYTKTLLFPFYEHPPFVFWIQSIFFKLFGDSYLIEKAYSFLTGIITAKGILLLWNFFTKEKTHNWFVLFIWITIPTVFWAYTNNILENTLGTFTVFSIYFILKYMKTNNLYLLLYGVFFIIISFLSKGFVGLFPLIVPIIYSITIDNNLKKNIKINGKLILLFLSLSTIILLVFSSLRENLIEYLNIQFFPSLKNKREITVTNRFKILLDLVIELLVPILLFAVLYIRSKNKKIIYRKQSLFFILVGMSASFPMIISMKQRKFYLVPSLPFFVIGLCLLILPYIKPKLDSFYINNKKVLIGLNVLLIVVLVGMITQFDGYLRDKDKIKDIKKVANVMKEGALISVPLKFKTEWQINAYFSRENFISLTEEQGKYYFLNKKKDKLSEYVRNNYVKLDLNLTLFNLYKLKTTN